MSFLVNYGRVAFAPLVDYFIETGTAPAIAGLAATAVWFGSAVMRLPTGWLLTFLKRNYILIAVGAGLAGGGVLTAIAPNIWVIIVGAFTFGLATGGFFIAANPLVSDLYPQHVGTALGTRGFFSQVAAVVTPFLVAITIWLGSWRIGFVVAAMLAALLTVYLHRSLAMPGIPTGSATDRDLFGGIRQAWPLIATGIAIVGIGGFVWQGFFNFYITYLGAEKGISTGVASILLTIMFAAGLPSFLIGGRLADRFDPLWLLLTILVAFCLSLGAITIIDGLVALLLVSILLGFVVHGLFPIGDAYVLGTLPGSHRASAYAGYSATMMLFNAPGSVIVGLLAQAGLGYGVIFQVFTGGIVILAVALWALALTGQLPGG